MDYTPTPPRRADVLREWFARSHRNGARPDRDFIIVTGAGRSGTSAVARVLHESGVSMGTNLAEPSDYNADGFYEDWGPWWLNERILRDTGTGDRWHPERWPSRATVRVAGQRYRDEMAQLVASATDGWKDPRFALTLEAWLPSLPAHTKVVACLRSPSAYAESVVRIYGLVDRAVAERQWARHYRRLLDVIRDARLNATCVEYDALIEQPDATVAALTAFVGRPLRAEYVNAPLRHNVRDVPPAYRELYERVAALGQGPRATNGVSGEGSGAKELEREVAVDYTDRVAALRARVVASSSAWQAFVRMPSPVANDETRAACEAYRSVVCAAQRELAALVPPPAQRDVHDRLAREVDLQRMIVELTLSAIAKGATDKRALKEAARAWRTYPLSC